MEDEVAGLGETNGMVVAFYELLWKKKNDRQEKQCKYPGFFVHIPDTIVYNFSQPQYWYFTSMNYRRVNKKKRQNLNSKNILEKFLRGRSRSGIVAGYLWNDDTPEGRARIREGGSPVCIRYLDAEGLKANLLRLGQFSGNGVLQQFIDPKTGVDGTLHNSMIQATWQPNHVTFERRQNKHSLTDSRYSYQKRAETFEGTFENSESYPLVSSILLDEITNICNGIAEHLWHVADCAVKRMVLNFRIDESNKVWFLFCSQISVIERDTLARPPAELLQPVGQKVRADPPVQKVASEREKQQQEAEAATVNQLIRNAGQPNAGYEELVTTLNTQTMLDRLPNMKVEAPFQAQHGRPSAGYKLSPLRTTDSKGEPLGPGRRLHNRPLKPQDPPKHPTLMKEKFSDVNWGASAEALKRIVFEKETQLSVSQR